MSDADAPSGAEPPAIDLRIVRGNPTDEEIAALTAVLSAVIAEQTLRAAEQAPAPLARTAWDRSRRNLRTSISAGPGHWRGFSG